LCEKYGPEKARRYVITGKFQGQRAKYAQAWLDRYDRDQAEAAARADHELAREANEIARASNTIAVEANRRARNANFIAIVSALAAVAAVAFQLITRSS
jgi:hypothetical protein